MTVLKGLKRAYAADNSVAKIYYGNQLVWSRTPLTQIALGVSPQTASLSLFQAFRTKMSPRELDYGLYFTDFPTIPLSYTSMFTDSFSLGSKPYITWSSSTGTLYGTTTGAYPTISTQLANAVTNVKNFPGTIIVRLCHEFNGNFGGTYGYTKETPEQFILGWKYVVDYFRANNVTNVKWCWGANIWEYDNPSSNTIDPRPYYPGDDYVDYIALDGYMTNMTYQVTSFESLFLQNYKDLMAMAPKPFMVGEVGASGTRGGFDKAGWINAMFTTLHNKMPRTEIVTWWDRDEYEISTGTGSEAAFAAGANTFTTPFLRYQLHNLIANTRVNGSIGWGYWAGSGGVSNIVQVDNTGDGIPNGTVNIGTTTQSTATSADSQIQVRTNTQWLAGSTYLAGVYIKRSTAGNVSISVGGATSVAVAVAANTWTWISAQLTATTTGPVGVNTFIVSWVGARAIGGKLSVGKPIVSLASDYKPSALLLASDWGDGSMSFWSWDGTVGGSNSTGPRVAY